MLYDPKGNMDMTGTFMPAYGLNRIFGEIPIIGALLVRPAFPRLLRRTDEAHATD